jgi:hypothetical protein
MPRPGPHGEENDVLMELVDLWIVDTKFFLWIKGLNLIYGLYMVQTSRFMMVYGFIDI